MIIRRENKRNYTTICNEVINDDRLSYEALGLLSYLLSRPENWEVHIDQLRSKHGSVRKSKDNPEGKRGPVGRDKIYGIVAELTDAGYMEHKRNYKDGKVESGYWIVREQPEQKGEQISTDEDLVPEVPDEGQNLVPGKLDPENLNPENTDAYKRLTDTKHGKVPSERAHARGSEAEPEPGIHFQAPDDDGVKQTFDALVDAWKRFAVGGAGAIGDSAKAAAAIGDLSPDDRAAAVERAPRYHRAQKDANRTKASIAIATYAKNREFDHHPPPPTSDTPAVQAVELKPYVAPLYAILWQAVHKARQATGDERFQRRLRDALQWLERGVTIPAAMIPPQEEVAALVPIKIDGPEHLAWLDWCTRVGIRLPRPDHVPVIYVPAAWPPPLGLTGAKPYRLALPVRVEMRSPTWFWRFYKRIEAGEQIVSMIGGHRLDLLESARRQHGAENVDYGPIPLAAEIAGMVEVKPLTDQFEQWSTWIEMRSGDLAMWPHGSIWCPTEFPTLIFGKEKQEAGAAA